MKLALSTWQRHLFPVALGLFLVSGCSTESVTDASDTEPTPAVADVVAAIATTVSMNPEAPNPPVTAEIVDVIEGGPAGEWGVKVDFPNGNGDGCYVDVVDKKSGDLLARDEVSDSPDSSTSHLVRFRYRGSIHNLAIRVTEKGTGTVLAESEHR